MKIDRVVSNNRTRAFDVHTSTGEYVFPWGLLEVRPARGNRVTEVFPDEELGREGFTYRLADGSEGSVHLDAVLEYNQDPEVLNELLLHRLTVEARTAITDSDLGKRELIRRLGTSASQFYRLLDPTNSSKSVGQMLALLHLLGREVDFVVRAKGERTA